MRRVRILAVVMIALAAGCATTTVPMTRWSGDLSGTWSVTRPHREPIKGQIVRVGEGRYELRDMYNLSGTYEVWKDMLVVKKPAHPNFTDLGWRIESPERLVVILSPPVAVVGTDHTGTVAEKLGTD